MIAEFKYPHPKVRCEIHGKSATLIRCYSSNEFINQRFFYICSNKKDDGGKCDFLKAAEFSSNSKNALNAEAWYRMEDKKKVKSNKEAKAGLAYHFQELNTAKQNEKMLKKKK